MTEDQIRKMLDEGEGFTVEYKECVNSLNDSVFETVASFSNRYGGHILLGVQEVNHKGVVIGVNRNAGLYEENILTGEKGFNLAAILLLGKEEVIQSACPGYRTDAIYRNENPDRYDDRLIVEKNLIESYDDLMGFIAKHTNDKFFLVDNVSTSVRDIIAREIVSNILVHREFSSAFPAKLIIEPDRIMTENWNRAQYPGKINPDAFTPYPKNPILAKFFVNIGRADTLGSGVRNLYKYTKIYCGGTPVLEEGDVFRIFVPLKTDENGNVNKYKLTERQQAILDLIKDYPAIQYDEIEKELNLSTSTVRRDISEIKKRVNLQYNKKTSQWELTE